MNNRKGQADEIEIESHREGMVPGIHTITYSATDDVLTLKHNIINRRALALGAVVAGEYLSDKQGVHTMDNLL